MGCDQQHGGETMKTLKYKKGQDHKMWQKRRAFSRKRQASFRYPFSLFNLLPDIKVGTR